MSKKQKTYTAEFKVEAIKLIKTKQESIFDNYVDKFNLIDIGSRIWKLNN